MEKKKLQSVSIAALIVSILPLAALAPSLLHLSLSDGDRTTWAGANVVFVLLGLILSVVCVRSRESRSIINIVSTAISVFWLLLMVGIVALAMFQEPIPLAIERFQPDVRYGGIFDRAGGRSECGLFCRK